MFLLLMVTGPGSAQTQCWTSSGCTGDTVPADDARDCCVGTNDGQFYGVGPGNCEVEQCHTTEKIVLTLVCRLKNDVLSV